MTTNFSQQPEESASLVRALPNLMATDGQAVPPAEFPANRGSPEGRYLSGPGKHMSRRVSDLRSNRADAVVEDAQSRHAVHRALDSDKDRGDNHRGGDRPWLLRCLIPLGVLAEGITAYVGMEALVTSQSLALGLSALTAVVGCGMACILANRRLNRLGGPAAVRILEGIFVAVLTVLRYESLSIQGAGYLPAAGAAALAALISALGLLGIEEIVVETRTFGILVSGLRLSWARWRSSAAAAGLARVQAQVQTAADKLEQHYLDHLLRTEGFPLEEARRRAAALKAAITGNGI